MRRLLIIIGAVMMLAGGAVAQEGRSEISLQGTGFFTKDSNGNGNLQRSTDTGGFMVTIAIRNNILAASENPEFKPMRMRLPGI